MSDVIYLSNPASVHMEEEWFEIATLDHFWIKRRFEVLVKLMKDESWAGQKIGEVGCGHGLLQKQFEQRYGVIVDGFDLGESALRKSVAVSHPRYCYNIFDRNPRFADAYDTLVLFDVLEHIEEEKPFMDALLFHLKPGGLLLVNVPAFMAFYSRYDEVLGHQRRYTLEMLETVCAGAGLRRTAATYWGLPWVPILMLRKLMLARAKDPRSIARRGYKPPSRLGNLALGLLGTLEPLPQLALGASLMAIYKKEKTRER